MSCLYEYCMGPFIAACSIASQSLVHTTVGVRDLRVQVYCVLSIYTHTHTHTQILTPKHTHLHTRCQPTLMYSYIRPAPLMSIVPGMVYRSEHKPPIIIVVSVYSVTSERRKQRRLHPKRGCVC